MVVWTLPAKNNLRQICNSIAYDSKIYAKRITQNIAAKPDLLEELPLLGKAVPELNDKQIREIAVYTYRIIYEVKSVNVFFSYCTQTS